MHGSCNARTEQKVTTIHQALSVGGSCEGAKQLQWHAECRWCMLFEIQGMSKLRERFNSLQMCEGGWEQSYESGRTPDWKKWIKVRLCPRTSRLGMVWVARRPSRRFLRLLQQFILLTKHGSLSTVSLLLEDVLLHWRVNHSPLSRPQRKDSTRISRTTARWWFCDWEW